MRAPVFLCSCTSIGTSPLQPVLPPPPPPPAGSFPLQPALLRRSWPSFDPLPVFCGLSMPSLCSLLALSVLSPCPPPDSFEGWRTSSAGLLRDVHAPASSIYRQSLVFFRSPVNAVFLGPLFRYRCTAKSRARLFPLGPDSHMLAFRLFFVSPSMLFYPYI